MSKIVTAWANAISVAEHKPEGYAKDITLRYIITAPFDAEAMWLTFDNFCSRENVIIDRATVAISDGGVKLEEGTVTEVTFNKVEPCMLIAGMNNKSDKVKFSVKKGQEIAVSFYLRGYTSMRSGVVVMGPLSKSFFAEGDFTNSDLDLEYTKDNNMVYFLSQIEFLTEDDNRSIVCYGDSITAQNWPDELAILFNANADNRTAVVRRAASGCRILRQYSCIKYDSYGLKADVRIPHEFPVSGADTVIIQEGINDIIHPVGVEENLFRPWDDMPTFEELRDGQKYIIEEMHKLGMKVYMGTLLPIGGWRTYEPFRDELRMKLNDWMKSFDEIEGCIDFDRAVQDIDRPSFMKTEYDSGDHLHPSPAGYKVMAKEAYPIVSG